MTLTRADLDCFEGRCCDLRLHSGNLPRHDAVSARRPCCRVFPPRLTFLPSWDSGTASGIASALSRLSGIVAPLVTGILLSISTSVLPLSLSALCFLATAGAAWGLVRVEERMGARLGRTSTLTH